MFYNHYNHKSIKVMSYVALKGNKVKRFKI